MAMSDKIHLWRSGPKAPFRTKCGIKPTKAMNVLWASTAQELKVSTSRICRTCLFAGPVWLTVVK